MEDTIFLAKYGMTPRMSHTTGLEAFLVPCIRIFMFVIMKESCKVCTVLYNASNFS